jgi:hypothetical protein
MTAMTDSFSSDLAQLRQRAALVRPLPVLATLLAWPLAALFTVIGFTVGRLWYLLVLAALTVAYGFCKGARIEVRPKAPGRPAQPSPVM